MPWCCFSATPVHERPASAPAAAPSLREASGVSAGVPPSAASVPAPHPSGPSVASSSGTGRMRSFPNSLLLDPAQLQQLQHLYAVDARRLSGDAARMAALAEHIGPCDSGGATSSSSAGARRPPSPPADSTVSMEEGMLRMIALLQELLAVSNSSARTPMSRAMALLVAKLPVDWAALTVLAPSAGTCYQVGAALSPDAQRFRGGSGSALQTPPQQQHGANPPLRPSRAARTAAAGAPNTQGGVPAASAPVLELPATEPQLVGGSGSSVEQLLSSRQALMVSVLEGGVVMTSSVDEGGAAASSSRRLEGLPCDWVRLHKDRDIRSFVAIPVMASGGSGAIVGLLSFGSCTHPDWAATWWMPSVQLICGWAAGALPQCHAVSRAAFLDQLLKVTDVRSLARLVVHHLPAALVDQKQQRMECRLALVSSCMTRAVVFAPGSSSADIPAVAAGAADFLVMSGGDSDSSSSSADSAGREQAWAQQPLVQVMLPTSSTVLLSALEMGEVLVVKDTVAYFGKGAGSSARDLFLPERPVMHGTMAVLPLMYRGRPIGCVYLLASWDVHALLGKLALSELSGLLAGSVLRRLVLAMRTEWQALLGGGQLLEAGDAGGGGAGEEVARAALQEEAADDEVGEMVQPRIASATRGGTRPGGGGGPLHAAPDGAPRPLRSLSGGSASSSASQPPVAAPLRSLSADAAKSVAVAARAGARPGALPRTASDGASGDLPKPALNYELQVAARHPSNCSSLRDSCGSGELALPGWEAADGSAGAGAGAEALPGSRLRNMSSAVRRQTASLRELLMTWPELLELKEVLARSRHTTVYSAEVNGVQLAVKVFRFATNLERSASSTSLTSSAAAASTGQENAELEALIATQVRVVRLAGSCEHVLSHYAVQPLLYEVPTRLSVREPNPAYVTALQPRRERHHRCCVLVTELCSGGSLREALARGALHGGHPPGDGDAAVAVASGAGGTGAGAAPVATEGGCNIPGLHAPPGTPQPDLCLLHEVLLQVARGMQHLHGLGIVHGELRSENIMVFGSLPPPPHQQQQRPVGGAAQSAGAAAPGAAPPGPPLPHLAPGSSCTASFTLKLKDIGMVTSSMTPRGLSIRKLPGRSRLQAASCLPPECLLGDALSRSSDVYAFAILVWELYTGQVAFQGFHSTPLQTVLSDGVRPQFPPAAPAWLTNIAERCWAAATKQRPSFRRIVAQLLAVEEAVRSGGPGAGRVAEC